MKRNFWAFVILFLVFAVVIFVIAATLPFNWGFCGIGLPAILGSVCLFTQLGTGANSKDNEWIYAFFGGVAGGAFALYVLIPLFLVL